MGEWGQLGLGNFDNQNTPQEVTALSGQCVTAVAAGTNHTVFVTDKGKVFACGNGEGGQLGLGVNEYTQHTPQEITALSDHLVTDVAAGECHTVFVTDKGKVFACGNGECGQLGLGNEENHYTPQEVTVLSEHHVIGVALGGYHTVFVTDKGKVFACGLGRYGKLGLGNKDDQNTPQEITALSGHCVVGVAAGNRHTVFVTAEGKVFSCGWGEYGQPGLGNKDDQSTPQEVTDLPATAIRSKLQELKEQEELAQKVEGVSLQSGPSVSS